MSAKILINKTQNQTRVAICRDGEIDELLVEHRHQAGTVGNIYLGTVVRVLAGMQSVFVDIGQERTAFLYFDDLPKTGRLDLHKMPSTSQDGIQRRLQAGDRIMVQVIKDAIGTKGARLSGKISLPSRHLVYLPNDANQINVSNKIATGERTRLKNEIVQLICQENLQGAIIVRTVAKDANGADLSADVRYLTTLWQQIGDEYKTAKASKNSSALLYQEMSLPLRCLRDFANEQTDEIWVDDKSCFDELCQFAQVYLPTFADKIHHFQEDEPLFERYGVEQAIKQALGRRVDLPSGGYLMIDQTEAMTVIDVNTGSFVGKHLSNETILQTNLEAAKTIAAQMRLRNLGGIIIADFIDMKSTADNKALLNNLKQQLAKDTTKPIIAQISELGLIEMTRKRTHKSLIEQFCQPCPVCDGSGRIKTTQTVSDEIVRDLLKMANKFKQNQILTIVAHKRVIEHLTQDRQILQDFEHLTGKSIKLHTKDCYLPEQFAIIANEILE